MPTRRGNRKCALGNCWNIPTKSWQSGRMKTHWRICSARERKKKRCWFCGGIVRRTGRARDGVAGIFAIGGAGGNIGWKFQLLVRASLHRESDGSEDGNGLRQEPAVAGRGGGGDFYFRAAGTFRRCIAGTARSVCAGTALGGPLPGK